MVYLHLATRYARAAGRHACYVSQTTVTAWPSAYHKTKVSNVSVLFPSTGVSGLFMCFLWITKLHPVPKVDNKFFKALLVVAAFHTIGHVAACTSFGQMAVSFAHIVKSAEPVFSVALAGPILKETYPYYVWLSLVPIVAGCGLSAMKEVSFAWNGFNNAMLSNVGMVLRNIYSKKALGDYKVMLSRHAACTCSLTC